MKKALLLILCLFAMPTTGFSDVIPEGYHTFLRDVVISNVNSYPDIVIVTYVKGPMIQNYEVHQVQENVPLELGYKGNTLNIFVVDKTYLTSAGGLDKIDFNALSQTKLNSDFIAPAVGSVPDDNPLVYEKITYEIQGKTGTDLTLHITQRLLQYRDGTPDTIETH